MDTEDGLITVLSTASYGARARETIEVFCCDILIDIANLPPKDMDTAITNIHKSLANHSTVARRIRLNTSKIMQGFLLRGTISYFRVTLIYSKYIYHFLPVTCLLRSTLLKNL